MIGCNRVGDTPAGLHYAGDSMIVDPLGVVLASAGDGEATLATELDPGAVATVRERYPFLRDRR